MMAWLSQINPWVGSLVAIAGVVFAYLRTQSRIRKELQSDAMKEAADRNEFRRSLLEHIAYVEDKNRTLEQRITELESTHRRTEEAYRKEIADLQERYAETQRKHLECEERILRYMKGRGSDDE